MLNILENYITYYLVAKLPFNFFLSYILDVFLPTMGYNQTVVFR